MFNININIEFVINLGPLHPSLHGVLRLITIINGEIIQWITSEIGLLHRSTEKIILSCPSFNIILPYYDRLDYVSTITQELLYIQTIERLNSCYCSNFVSIWRTLFLEIYRNLNHCLNITTHAIDIGLFTTMLVRIWLKREVIIIYRKLFWLKIS